MKKPTQTHTPVVPKGYTGQLKDFNRWQKSLQREIDRVKNTNIAVKLTA